MVSRRCRCRDESEDFPEAQGAQGYTRFTAQILKVGCSIVKTRETEHPTEYQRLSRSFYTEVDLMMRHSWRGDQARERETGSHAQQHTHKHNR